MNENTKITKNDEDWPEVQSESQKQSRSPDVLGLIDSEEEFGNEGDSANASGESSTMISKIGQNGKFWQWHGCPMIASKFERRRYRQSNPEELVASTSAAVSRAAAVSKAAAGGDSGGSQITALSFYTQRPAIWRRAVRQFYLEIHRQSQFVDIPLPNGFQQRISNGREEKCRIVSDLENVISIQAQEPVLADFISNIFPILKEMVESGRFDYSDAENEKNSNPSQNSETRKS